MFYKIQSTFLKINHAYIYLKIESTPMQLSAVPVHPPYSCSCHCRQGMKGEKKGILGELSQEAIGLK